MSNSPIKRIRVGNITVSIFQDQGTGKNGPFTYHSVVIQRSYRDNAGDWKHTASLNGNDIPNASAALNLAHAFVHQTEAELLTQSEAA